MYPRLSYPLDNNLITSTQHDHLYHHIIKSYRHHGDQFLVPQENNPNAANTYTEQTHKSYPEKSQIQSPKLKCNTTKFTSITTQDFVSNRSNQ